MSDRAKTAESLTIITHTASYCHFHWTPLQGRALVLAGMQVSKKVLPSVVSTSPPTSWRFPSDVTSLLPPPLCPAVCEDCMEMDPTTIAIIIIVDVCLTLGLLMAVYYWSKNRKAKAKPVTRGTGAGGRSRGKTIKLGQETFAWARMGSKSTADCKQLFFFFSTVSVIPRSLQRVSQSRPFLSFHPKKIC